MASATDMNEDGLEYLTPWPYCGITTGGLVASSSTPCWLKFNEFLQKSLTWYQLWKANAIQGQGSVYSNRPRQGYSSHTGFRLPVQKKLEQGSAGEGSRVNTLVDTYVAAMQVQSPTEDVECAITYSPWPPQRVAPPMCVWSDGCLLSLQHQHCCS